MKGYFYPALYRPKFEDSTFPVPQLCDLLCHLLKLSKTELPKSSKEMVADLQMEVQLCKAACKWLVCIINLSVVGLRGGAEHLSHVQQLQSVSQRNVMILPNLNSLHLLVYRESEHISSQENHTQWHKLSLRCQSMFHAKGRPRMSEPRITQKRAVEWCENTTSIA